MSKGGDDLRRFAGTLRFDIPKRLHQHAGRVYLDAVTQLYGALVHTTPVDTGYLRASLTASVGDAAPDPMPPKDKRKGKRWRGSGRSTAPAASAVIGALRGLQPVTMGYRAEYAPYVEDKQRFFAAARARWPHFLINAVRNATV